MDLAIVHKHIRSRKGQTTNLSGTVRIASIMQKSIKSGRSSYVEMRSVGRLMRYNLRLRLDSIRLLVGNEHYQELASLLDAVSGGYDLTLTPNGAVRQNDLDSLLSIDSDIALHLSILESDLKSNKNNLSQIDEKIQVVRELIQERKNLVEGLRVLGAS